MNDLFGHDARPVLDRLDDGEIVFHVQPLDRAELQLFGLRGGGKGRYRRGGEQKRGKQARCDGHGRLHKALSRAGHGVGPDLVDVEVKKPVDVLPADDAAERPEGLQYGDRFAPGMLVAVTAFAYPAHELRF